MLKFEIFLSLLFFNLYLAQAKLLYIEVKYPLLGKESPPGSPWPLPEFMNGTTDKILYLKKSAFQIKSNFKVDCDIIKENIKHYKNIIFPPKIYSNVTKKSKGTVTYLNSLNIYVTQSDSCPRYPDSTMDESYNLTISSKGAELYSESVWGALRGLETFSQLTYFTDDNKLVLNDSTFIIDKPRFAYRGLLIDTSRHFIPVPILRKQIDAMAYHKLNVFHWHIVDDQSFPLELLKYPKVTEKGRYSKAHVYTRKDVMAIIEHARLRGIRVIPEFDSPGHVDAFGKTFPEFLTVCWKDGKPYQPIFGVQGPLEIINPTNENVYPVLKDILTELKNLFVDEFIHLGNDEVYYECWKSNPDIQNWMRKMNFSEYHHLQAYYSTRVLNIVEELGKKSTVWQDVWDNGVELPKGTQIQIWKDTSILPEHLKWSEYLNEITKDGYAAILSSPWYINFVSYGYQEWYKFYQVDPFANFTGTEEQAKLLIGGEAAIWTEYVDGGNLDSRLWPRLSAISERLWSPASVNDPEDAKFRLDEQRCRLLRRGIVAAPVLNGYCGDYEYGMSKSNIFDPVFNYGWPDVQTN